MYNYLEAVINDVIDYIMENDLLDEYHLSERNELADRLYDELFTEDSVTGNGSGSYTFNRNKAKEYVNNSEDGWDIFRDVVDSLGMDATEIAEHLSNQDWEWFDVVIRLGALPDAISEALDQLEEEGQFTD